MTISFCSLQPAWEAHYAAPANPHQRGQTNSGTVEGGWLEQRGAGATEAEAAAQGTAGRLRPFSPSTSRPNPGRAAQGGGKFRAWVRVTLRRSFRRTPDAARRCAATRSRRDAFGNYG